jgi:hypothetical protein
MHMMIGHWAESGESSFVCSGSLREARAFMKKTEIIHNKTRLWMASPNYSAVRRQHLIYYENGSETTKMIHDLLKIKISSREKYEKASISCKGIRPYQAPIRNKGLDALD